jgi:hypothetical protein
MPAEGVLTDWGLDLRDIHIDPSTAAQDSLLKLPPSIKVSTKPGDAMGTKNFEILKGTLPA